MKSRIKKGQNILDLKPARTLEWETAGNEQVILLVPKFRRGFLANWLQPRLSKPFIKVKLDDHGSFFWNQCDGKTTVFEIAGKMKERFGENFDPGYRRVGKFVSQLISDDFLHVDDQQPN